MYLYKAVVKNVVDGDTIDVAIDLGFKISTIQRIRLSNIDTPERGQPNYAEAKNFVIEQVLNKEIMIRTFKISKFGYYLGEVTIGDFNLNQALLSEGLAKEYNGEKK